MAFRIIGLDPRPFSHLFGLSDRQLDAAGARRFRVDRHPGFPDRVELRDLQVGESALLVNHVHQPADTPYRASHAIFVREHAAVACEVIDEVPLVMRTRPISLRAFAADHMMVDAVLVDGQAARAAIEEMFARPQVAYLQAHYAVRGCFAARIERV